MAEGEGGRQERIGVALPPIPPAPDRSEDEDALDPELLDPEDPDERAMLIRLAHPELGDALDQGEKEVEVAGEAMNPRHHLLVHEVVANQLIELDPLEAWETATRLLSLGYDRHEIQHMLGSAVATQLWTVMQEGRPADHHEYLVALQALPGSWQAQPPRRPPPSPARRRGPPSRRRRR